MGRHSCVQPSAFAHARQAMHYKNILTTTGCFRSLIKYGTSIMVLHDFSDPWMEAAKLCNYTGFKTVRDRVLF